MATVFDHASEFARRARSGEKPRVAVSKAHAHDFFTVLARDGFVFAKECIDEIQDPELRRIVQAIFFSTAAGAAGGAALGAMIAGPPGAQVGAVIGAGAGFLTGCIAVTLVGFERDGRLVISVE